MHTTIRSRIPSRFVPSGQSARFGRGDRRSRWFLVTLGLWFCLSVFSAAASGLRPTPGSETMDEARGLDAPPIAWIGGWKGHSGPLTDARNHALIPAFRDLRRRHEDLVLLSCGSMLGPSPVSYADQGRLILSLMQRCEVDAMAVGPHDFFAGSAALLDRAAEARFPFICTNLRVNADKTSPTLDWGKILPAARLSRRAKNLLVLAVVCPTVAKDWPNWDPALTFADPLESLQPFQSEAQEADMVIVLSNMMFDDNLRLLQRLPWIDAILTNPISPHAEEALDVLRFDFGLNDGRRICYALSNPETGYGLLRPIREDGKPWLLARPCRLPADAPVDPEDVDAIARAEEATRAAAGNVLTHLTNEEQADVVGLFLGALRSALDGEVAVIHESAIQARKVPLDPTALDIQSAFPFPDRVALMNVRGSVLRAMWQRQTRRHAGEQVFRILGMGKHQNQLLVNDRPLRDNDTYRLATSEFLAVGGFGLLPPDPRSVRPERFVDLLARHFAKIPENRRAATYQAPSRGPVLRQKWMLSGSYDQLAFSDAASAYQYRDPQAAFTGSDIPGLVGARHLRRTFGLDYEAILDRPQSDSMLSLKSTYAEMEPVKLLDGWQLLLRHTKKSLEPGFFPFLEVNLRGAHRKPEVAGHDRPLFGKAVAGLSWKASDRLRWFVGMGHLKRFSVDGQPGNTGPNLGFELSANLARDVTLTTTFDGFMTWDSDEIRTYDGQVQLQAKLFKRLSFILRESLFGWEDAAGSRLGTRRETFSGLGYDLSLRHFGSRR